jgi:hypothetical protein
VFVHIVAEAAPDVEGQKEGRRKTEGHASQPVLHRSKTLVSMETAGKRMRRAFDSIPLSGNSRNIHALRAPRALFLQTVQG